MPLALQEGFPALLAECARVLLAVPAIEWRRKRQGPEPLLLRYRDRGRASSRRDDPDRRLLRRAIAAVDRRFPDGGNCYRRVLLEIALDSGAADEDFVMGFRLKGEQGQSTDGHVWLASEPPAEGEAAYDVIVRL